MEKASDINTILKSSALKITENRIKVIKFLMKINKPVTADQVSKSLNINIVTIYRTLELLAQKNIIYKTDFREGKNYFEFQDKNHHHHHITCSNCGIREHIDFCIKEKEHKAIVKNTSFNNIDSHILEFFAICNKCRN